MFGREKLDDQLELVDFDWPSQREAEPSACATELCVALMSQSFSSCASIFAFPSFTILHKKKNPNTCGVEVIRNN
jgi:hypothetical protein